MKGPIENNKKGGGGLLIHVSCKILCNQLFEVHVMVTTTTSGYRRTFLGDHDGFFHNHFLLHRNRPVDRDFIYHGHVTGDRDLNKRG